MIVYKVVTSTRKSAVVGDKNYCITYNKGEIIETIKGTFGIFCFKTLYDAKIFISLKNDKSLKILKVKTMTNKRRNPKFIGYYMELKKFYDGKIHGFPFKLAYDGTVLYDKVMVLD